MKAATRINYCLPDQIKVEEMEKPLPKDHEVLIKVSATTVNRTDAAILTGKPFIMRFFLGFIKPRNKIIGSDFAGDVVAIGKKVTSYRLNDRVFGFNDLGMASQAEYLTIPEDGNILSIPVNIDYSTAAASLEGAHYAYSFIHKVNMIAGQRILINGATGAIGSALLQFVKQFNVHITATCHTKNMKLVESLGAHEVIDYTKMDFTNGHEKYDFVFDAVGKSTFGKCKPLLNDGGIYISSELGPFAQNLFFVLSTALMGNKKVIFPKPFSLKVTMPYLLNQLKKGAFHPMIDRTYILKDISKAYKYVRSGEKTGNVLINMKS